MDEYIDSFQASVKEGEYDPEKNQFAVTTNTLEDKSEKAEDK